VGLLVNAHVAASAQGEGFVEERRIRGIRKLLFWPDAGHLIGLGRTKTQMLDLTTSRIVWESKERCFVGAMDRGGKYLVILGGRKVLLLDGQTGKLIRTIMPLKEYNNDPRDVAISPDGRTLAVATGHDFSVHLHQLPGGRPRRLVKTEQPAGCVAFSPNGLMLAVSGDVSKFSIYDSAGRRKLKQLTWNTRIGGTAAHFVFSPNSRRLAALVRGEVWLWDLSSRRVVRKFQAQVGMHGKIAFSPDGKWIAASGMWRLKPNNMYAAVRIWETGTGREVATLTDLDEGNHAEGLRFAFAPDGKRLAIAFPHLRTGPAAVIWRWGPRAEGVAERIPAAARPPGRSKPPAARAKPAPGTEFTMTVTTQTGSRKHSGTDNVKPAVLINGDPKHQAVLDNPGVNDFELRAVNTFESLKFRYPVSEVEKVVLTVLKGDDAWELRTIAFQFFQGSRQTRRYVFPVNRWFSADRTDVKGQAKQRMEFVFRPKLSFSSR